MIKVLVVEDDRSHLNMAVKLLEGAGYGVVPHNTPLGLHTITEKEKPHLILLDASMPFMGVKELVDSIRKTGAGRKAVILFFSDHNPVVIKSMVDEMNVDGYISKSATHTEFIEKVAFHTGGEEDKENWYDSATLVTVPDLKEQERIANIFAMLGMRVDIAATEEETLARVRDNRYCSAVIESAAGGAEGAALYKRILKADPELVGKALFIGAPVDGDGKVEGGLARTARELGCRYLSRPFDSMVFVEAIDTLRKQCGYNDRRTSLRYNWMNECSIVGLSSIDTIVRDISMEGVRVRYMGAPMMTGIVKNVLIKDPYISRVAEVKWSRPSGKAAEAGLVFTRPVPQSVLSLILPR